MPASLGTLLAPGFLALALLAVVIALLHQGKTRRLVSVSSLVLWRQLQSAQGRQFQARWPQRNLPMLLQMPLFFALYQVLSNAIDLRQAPFVGWIHDLSAPDHLFSVAGFSVHLLPIIMAATGFLQQRLTPTPPGQRTSASGRLTT